MSDATAVEGMFLAQVVISQGQITASVHLPDHSPASFVLVVPDNPALLALTNELGEVIEGAIVAKMRDVLAASKVPVSAEGEVVNPVHPCTLCGNPVHEIGGVQLAPGRWYERRCADLVDQNAESGDDDGGA